MSNIICGHHPVVETIRAGKPVEKIFFQQGLTGDLEKEIRHLSREYGIPLQIVPKEKLNRMVNGIHQGVAAMLSIIEYASLEDEVNALIEQGEVPLVLVLDRITDVRNFGAIARSAACAGVHLLVFGETESATVSEDSMKASAGALSRLKICREKSLFTAVDLLKSYGLQLVVTALTGKSKKLADVDMRVPLAVVLGSEDMGVHPKFLRMADQVAKIPQVSTFDSYNVSVAAGIVLYEVQRQRDINGE